MADGGLRRLQNYHGDYLDLPPPPGMPERPEAEEKATSVKA